MRKERSRHYTTKEYPSGLPRKSSPEGIKARQQRRLKAFVPEIPKGGSGTNRCRKPGSCNPRKVGR
jgi:hypothetical protein